LRPRPAYTSWRGSQKTKTKEQAETGEKVVDLA
jgi:hypothetical protein